VVRGSWCLTIPLSATLLSHCPIPFSPPPSPSNPSAACLILSRSFAHRDVSVKLATAQVWSAYIALSSPSFSSDLSPLASRVPVDENGYRPGSLLCHLFVHQLSLSRGPPKVMAITKWISFGANQQNPTSPVAQTQGGLPSAVVVSSAVTKEFGLENVCPRSILTFQNPSLTVDPISSSETHGVLCCIPTASFHPLT
jgi:hypothetical protein